jgi:hypothetical protein
MILHGQTFDNIPIRKQPLHIFSTSENIIEQEIPFEDTNPVFESPIVGSPEMNLETWYVVPNKDFVETQ